MFKIIAQVDNVVSLQNSQYKFSFITKFQIQTGAKGMMGEARVLCVVAVTSEYTGAVS